MVLDKEPIFENCLIQTNKNNLYKNPIINLEKKIDLVDESNNLELTYINQESNSLLVNDNTEIDQNQSNEYSQNDSIHLEKVEEEIIIGNKEKKIMNKSLEKIDDPEITLDIEDLENNVDRYKTDFKEISIDSNLDNNSNDNLEEITLRKPNRIYFELYKKARDKAKQAKKEAILAYLEAKNIKNTYMIDNLNDEDYSTLDDEIDDVSESELENLER
jgi:hypothetical protein